MRTHSVGHISQLPVPSQGKRKHQLPSSQWVKRPEEPKNGGASWKPVNWTREEKDDSLVKLAIAFFAFQKKD